MRLSRANPLPSTIEREGEGRGQPSSSLPPGGGGPGWGGGLTTEGPVRTGLGPDDLLAEAGRWRAEGRRVALATVVATWGSSPRPVGSQLAVDESGNMLGSVSGGCIEGAVVHEAGSVMESGEPKLLEYGVTDEMAWEVGLACGGTVKVFVERLD